MSAGGCGTEVQKEHGAVEEWEKGGGEAEQEKKRLKGGDEFWDVIVSGI